MPPTRDPPQNKRPTWTEREGLEKKYSKHLYREKNASVAILISDKIDFKTKAIKRDPEGHFIILEGRNYQENINIINIYVPNIGVPKYIRKILEDFKKDIDSNTLILRDFNIPLSKIDRSSKQNVNKDTVALNNTPDQMYLIDIYRYFIPKQQNITFFFKCTWNIFKDRTHDRIENKPQQIQEN